MPSSVGDGDHTLAGLGTSKKDHTLDGMTAFEHTSSPELVNEPLDGGPGWVLKL